MNRFSGKSVPCSFWGLMRARVHPSCIKLRKKPHCCRGRGLLCWLWPQRQGWLAWGSPTQNCRHLPAGGVGGPSDAPSHRPVCSFSQHVRVPGRPCQARPNGQRRPGRVPGAELRRETTGVRGDGGRAGGYGQIGGPGRGQREFLELSEATNEGGWCWSGRWDRPQGRGQPWGAYRSSWAGGAGGENRGAGRGYHLAKGPQGSRCGTLAHKLLRGQRQQCPHLLQRPPPCPHHQRSPPQLPGTATPFHKRGVQPEGRGFPVAPGGPGEMGLGTSGKLDLILEPAFPGPLWPREWTGTLATTAGRGPDP